MGALRGGSGCDKGWIGYLGGFGEDVYNLGSKDRRVLLKT